jgi:hypothetical protein
MIRPELEYICELNVLLDPAMVVGETAHGIRRIVPIIGGTVKGPQLNGEIIKAGADWQLVRQDGCTELDAHYQFITDEGVLIYILNVGVRVAAPEIAARIAKGEQVDSSQYYFRAVPKFEAPIQSKYAFLNDAIFVCTAERLPNSVRAWIWKLL